MIVLSSFGWWKKENLPTGLPAEGMAGRHQLIYVTFFEQLLRGEIIGFKKGIPIINITLLLF